MTDRIINLRAWEAAALNEGRATSLVRVCKPQPPQGHSFHGVTLSSTCRADEGKAVFAIGQSPLLKDAFRIRCPFGAPWDLILGRETWAAFETPDYWTGECNEVEIRPSEMRSDTHYVHAENVVYRADETSAPDRWRSSVTMPKWAIRARYTNAGVRCMRVQELSAGDKWECGMPVSPDVDPTHEYADRFDRDHGHGAWAANPWVFFARLTK